MANNQITVELIYLAENKAWSRMCEMPIHSSILDVLHYSKIKESFPNLVFNQQLAVGIYGKVKKLSDEVSEGDRIEIYRPLQINPKEARRSKANKR